MKLQTVLLSYSGTQLTNIQDTLEQIKELCCLDGDDDEKLISGIEFKNSLTASINKLSVDVKTEKILRVNYKCNIIRLLYMYVYSFIVYMIFDTDK